MENNEKKESAPTNGELFQNGANGIHTKQGHCVALTYGENGLDRKANAKRIVKRWNMHDELTKALLDIKILYGDKPIEEYLEPYKTAWENIEKLLKQSEQE